MPAAQELAARAAALDGDETPERVDALNALADALGPAESAERLEVAEAARALAQRIGYGAGYAVATAVAGAARSALSDPVGALGLLLEAEQCEADLPPTVALWVRKALAAVYTDLGHFDEVLRVYHGLLERARTCEDAALEAWTYNGLSVAATSLDDATNGLRFGERALATFDTLGDAEGRTAAHLGVGTALARLGQSGEGRPHLEAALGLARAGGNGYAEAQALHHLAVLAVEEGRVQEALLLLRVALDLRRSSGSRQDECVSLLEIGKTLRVAGKPKEAIETMEEALALAESLGARLRVSQAHLALADTFETLGRNGQALRHLRRHQAAREEVLGQEMMARLEALTAKNAADRSRQEADHARQHSEALSEKNAELEALLAELRRTQAQLVQSEKLASLGRLTSGVAHELKNPLNFVTNFADLSVELAADLRGGVEAAVGEVPGPLAEDFDTLALNLAKIGEHGRRADGIVRSMMGHARATAGERRPCDLHDLLRRAVEAARRARLGAGPVDPEVVYDLDPQVGTVTVSPDGLLRGVLNLVDNALYAVTVRAATAGTGYGPLVVIRTRRGDGAVEVRVEDNGPGMTEDVRIRAFEPFYTTRPTGEGVGLGLSLAYDIVVHGHGGTLAVEDGPGGGAALVVVLPVEN